MSTALFIHPLFVSFLLLSLDLFFVVVVVGDGDDEKFEFSFFDLLLSSLSLST